MGLYEASRSKGCPGDTARAVSKSPSDMPGMGPQRSKTFGPLCSGIAPRRTAPRLWASPRRRDTAWARETLAIPVAVVLSLIPYRSENVGHSAPGGLNQTGLHSNRKTVNRANCPAVLDRTGSFTTSGAGPPPGFWRESGTQIPVPGVTVSGHRRHGALPRYLANPLSSPGRDVLRSREDLGGPASLPGPPTPKSYPLPPSGIDLPRGAPY
jgi:hypothetical protein